MSDTRKFFENRLNFQRYNRHDDKRFMSIPDTMMYKSKIIPDPRAVGIYNSGDIYNQVKSLLYYSASEHISTEYEGHRYVYSGFDIGIMTVSEEGVPFNYKKLMRVDVEPGFNLSEFRVVQLDPHANYSCLILIYVDAYGCYRLGNEEAEKNKGESKAESKDELITLEAYKEDKCVVCFNNELKILFYDCVHYCVCRECEERNPFKKCPYCRTRILTKIIF